MARKDPGSTFLTPVDELWWPQQREMLWSPPPIPHLLSQLKVPEQTGSAHRERGRPQSLSRLGKRGFPRSAPAAEDKGETSAREYLGVKLSPKQIPLCPMAWNSAAHLPGPNPSQGFRANTATLVWLWFSAWHRNLHKCHPEHSQEELDPKPLEIPGNAAVSALLWSRLFLSKNGAGAKPGSDRAGSPRGRTSAQQREMSPALPSSRAVTALRLQQS